MRPTRLWNPIWVALMSDDVINVTNFTQSIGAESLANADFSAWSGDNPSSWSVIGENAPDPEVTERDPNQAHADTPTTGGAANLYSTATLSGSPGLAQTSLEEGGIYLFEINVSNYVSGQIQWLNTSPIGNVTAAGVWSPVNRYSSTQFRINVRDPVDLTLDYLGAKKITVNTQQPAFTNGSFVFRFTLPASPTPHQMVHLLYRLTGELDNCWEAIVYRNATNSAWSASLFSISSGTRTNRISVADVGAPTMIGVHVDGDDHKLYTGTGATIDGATWTQRGGTITNTTHNDKSAINCIYNPNATPHQLYATTKDIFS